MNTIRFILILAFLLYACTACKTRQVATETFHTDSLIIREIPEYIYLPADTVYSESIHIDSLVALLQAGVPTQVIERLTIREDPETGHRVGILIDELGNLTALCEIQEQQIQYLRQELERIRTERTTTTITERPGFLQRVKDSLDLILYAALAVLLISFLIRLIRP